jgi:hypothetical protein
VDVVVDDMLPIVRARRRTARPAHRAAQLGKGKERGEPNVDAPSVSRHEPVALAVDGQTLDPSQIGTSRGNTAAAASTAGRRTTRRLRCPGAKHCALMHGAEVDGALHQPVGSFSVDALERQPRGGPGSRTFGRPDNSCSGEASSTPSSRHLRSVVG